MVLKTSRQATSAAKKSFEGGAFMHLYVAPFIYDQLILFCDAIILGASQSQNNSDRPKTTSLLREFLFLIEKTMRTSCYLALSNCFFMSKKSCDEVWEIKKVSIFCFSFGYGLR